jgi:hypothetical protein
MNLLGRDKICKGCVPGKDRKSRIGFHLRRLFALEISTSRQDKRMMWIRRIHIYRDYAAGLPAAVQKWFWEANPPSLTSTSFLFCSQIVSWKP